jgi:ABC-type lipopolysaccharide export system ATPase subunit
VQVGDIVKHFLTEQIGIVMTIHNSDSSLGSIQVLWTTQGESIFRPGGKEWCSKNSLTVLTTA